MIYTMDNIAQFAADKEAGRMLEVDRELFDWFLEVLPPIHMNYVATVRNDKGDGWITIHAAFGFAEGAELVTAFWYGPNQRFFAQQTKEFNPFR